MVLSFSPILSHSEIFVSFFFLKNGIVVFLSIKECWLPPKVLQGEVKIESRLQRAYEIYKIFCFLYTISFTPKTVWTDRSLSQHGWTLIRLQSISHFSPPHWPPYAGWDYPPPFLPTLAPPSCDPTQLYAQALSIQSWWERRNICHRWAVTLQCRKRWLLVSPVSLHKKHLVTTVLPFFWSTSCVRQAFLTTIYFGGGLVLPYVLPQLCVHSVSYAILL